MKIIVLGATGFIGKSLVKELLKNNYKIVVFTRYHQKAYQLFQDTVEIVEWDGIDESILGEHVENAFAFINLAGENISSKPWTKKQKFKILQSRSQLGTTISNTLSHIKKLPKVYIQSSAIGFYGYNLSGEISENDENGSGYLACVTHAWEHAVEEVNKLDIRKIVLRTGVVLGRRGGIFPMIYKSIKYFAGSIFGSGEQFMSWIHIEDQVRAIVFLMENDKEEGVFNLTSPRPATFKELVKKSAKRMGRPVLLRIPGWLLRLIFKEMGKELLLSNQKVLPTRLQKTNFAYRYPNIDMALDDLLRN